MKKLAVVLLCLLLPFAAGADMLARNSLPAERARGCVWAETFETEARVNLNEGTATGSPTISKGVTLDGSSQYISYVIPSKLFSRLSSITIVVEFIPDFDWDDDNERHFFSSTSGKYMMRKCNNANNNVLRLVLGDTVINEIAPAIYSAYWLQGQRNVIVVSGTTGNTNVWLNGTQILSADGTAWSVATDQVMFYVGSSHVASQLFDGEISSFQIYNTTLTGDEAQDFYDQDTYSYMDNAVAAWPMFMAQHDPTNNRTLDISGNGHNLDFTGPPDKLVIRGYDFDGTNDYMDTSGIYSSGSFSVQCTFISDTAAALTYGILINEWSPIGNQRGWQLERSEDDIVFLISSDGTAGTVSSVTKSACVQAGRLFSVTVTYEENGASDVISAYVNELAVATTSGALGPAYPGTSDLVVGAQGNYSYKWNGSISECSLYDNMVLTNLQHLDYRIRMRNQINMR